MRIARRLPWTLVVPALALIALGATWGRKPGDVVLALVAALLAGAVLASVHRPRSWRIVSASRSVHSSSP
jgi:hypothetical protein